jgi:hypothetical protein
VVQHFGWTPAKGVRYFGAEIEMECSEGSPQTIINNINSAVRDDARLGILKHDGSLSNGVELVTLPMSLKQWNAKDNPVLRACAQAIRDGARADKTSTCGLHIHVSRDTVSEPTIAKLVMFLNDPASASWLRKFARRSTSAGYAAASAKVWKAPPVLAQPNQGRLSTLHRINADYAVTYVDVPDSVLAQIEKYILDNWAPGEVAPGYRTGDSLRFSMLLPELSDEPCSVAVIDRPGYSFADGSTTFVAVLQCYPIGNAHRWRVDVEFVSKAGQQRAKKYGKLSNQGGRYTPLNLENSPTIEFRIFKGSLNPQTILATVEFCDALIEWAKDTSAAKLTTGELDLWLRQHVSRKTYPTLLQYLVRRKLREERVVKAPFKAAAPEQLEPDAEPPTEEILPAPAVTTDRFCDIDGRRINLGDRVCIVQRVGSNTNNWANCWVDAMDRHVACTYTVTEMRGSGVRLNGDGGEFGWPWHALRVVESAQRAA